MSQPYTAPVIVTGGRRTGKTARILAVVAEMVNTGSVDVYIYVDNEAMQARVDAQLKQQIDADKYQYVNLVIHTMDTVPLPLVLCEPDDKRAFFFVNLSITQPLASFIATRQTTFHAPVYAEIAFRDGVQLIHMEPI